VQTRTVARILQLLADAAGPAELAAEVYVPDAGYVLRRASSLLHDDASWMVPRVELPGLWFAAPGHDAALLRRLGVEPLSALVEEARRRDRRLRPRPRRVAGGLVPLTPARPQVLDPASPPEVVPHPSAARWAALLGSAAFLDGVARIVDDAAAACAAPPGLDVRARLAGYQVRLTPYQAACQPATRQAARRAAAAGTRCAWWWRCTRGSSSGGRRRTATSRGRAKAAARASTSTPLHASSTSRTPAAAPPRRGRRWRKDRRRQGA
jgi:hypothetical protein